MPTSYQSNPIKGNAPIKKPTAPGSTHTPTTPTTPGEIDIIGKLVSLLKDPSVSIARKSELIAALLADPSVSPVYKAAAQQALTPWLQTLFDSAFEANDYYRNKATGPASNIGAAQAQANSSVSRGNAPVQGLGQPTDRIKGFDGMPAHLQPNPNQRPSLEATQLNKAAGEQVYDDLFAKLTASHLRTDPTRYDPRSYLGQI